MNLQSSTLVAMLEAYTNLGILEMMEKTRALEAWRRMRLLEEAVEMNTDPLVLIAFGKGHFFRSCEVIYSSPRPEARQKKA
ncbi:hypothetical protein HHK36_013116 [Tetracentron sinense]|uniref:Uncharacterized protein n=1 Tax=Tetracentron sinense TaxID=13715 RepID=A0A834Z735_TETSI|nr:hypothetical protein HHK36_013116 [Tetracentron sinense]